MPSKLLDAFLDFITSPPKYFEPPTAYHDQSGYPAQREVFHASTFMTIVTPLPPARPHVDASTKRVHDLEESIPLVEVWGRSGSVCLMLYESMRIWVVHTKDSINESQK
ncbi:hypothetical protein FIBSPDRAFT_883997 [Athelia psychrophila]|uniref:Uncharacterized protein n=1 Tax=Athelia psychrophila TaxID=1759441 RepID=A0A166TBR2_9AGAM|nr:hypothetical protein FIBSPDRAFT_897620 [Fibularhizoctonia sp. CBS 109695]KZP30445.1 hypothetical protein FIBSPDRAFT_883997 [Fibularhizoctonia sp. CBS 109695]